jgi:hypothetical protein
MPMTDYLQNAVANATLRNTAYTSPANVYASLYSVAPTESTVGTEITGNGYSRQSVTFSAPSLGSLSSNVAVTFTCSGNNWPVVVAFGVTDASTSGNILYYAGISGRTVQVGDSVVFASGDITIQIT